MVGTSDVLVEDKVRPGNTDTFVVIIGGVRFYSNLPHDTLYSINYVSTVCSLLPFTLKIILETFTAELCNLAFLSIAFCLHL